jgi:ubiquitin conjugation factor E4 B
MPPITSHFRRPLGPPELVSSLLALSALSTPLFSNTNADTANVLTPNDVDQFLQDLARWHESDPDLYSAVMAPVIRGLLFHESLVRPGGLGGGDSGWRGVVSGLEALVSVKGMANLIVNMEEWNPPNATAADFERVSLMGPLCRLNVFAREWVRYRLRF